MLIQQKALVVVSAALLCTLFLSQVPWAATVPEGVEDAALAGLPKFLEGTLADDVTHYGFRDAAELARVTLGKPFQIHTLHPDDILAFAEGWSVELPIRPTTMWQFPVLCDGTIRTLLIVDLMDGKWEAVNFGGLSPGPEMMAFAERWPLSEGYELQYVHVFQTGSQFAAVTRDGLTQMVPLESTARSLGMLGKGEMYESRRLEMFEIIPVLAPHVRANVELIEESSDRDRRDVR